MYRAEFISFRHSHPCSGRGDVSQKHAVPRKHRIPESDGHTIRRVPRQVIRDPLHLPQLDGFVIQHEPVETSLIIGGFEAVGVSETELDFDHTGAYVDGWTFGEDLQRVPSFISLPSLGTSVATIKIYVFQSISPGQMIRMYMRLDDLDDLVPLLPRERRQPLDRPLRDLSRGEIEVENRVDNESFLGLGADHAEGKGRGRVVPETVD